MLMLKFSDPDVISPGLENGLKALAGQIIIELAAVPKTSNIVQPLQEKIRADTIYNGNPANLENFIQKTLGLSAVFANSVATTLVAIKDINAPTAFVQAGGNVNIPDRAFIDEANVNVAYNQNYVNAKIIATKIRPGVGAPVGPVAPGVPSGSGMIPATSSTGTGDISADYLYGKEINDAINANNGLRVLVTASQLDGIASQLVDGAKSKLVWDAINALGSAGDFNNNPARAALLGFIDYFVTKGGDVGANNNGQIVAIKQAMIDALDKYATMVGRLTKIPTTNTIAAHLKNAFVAGFVLYTGKRLNKDLTTATQGRNQTVKNNLTNAKIKSFYDGYVVKDEAFYERFFNLVQKINGKEEKRPLAAAVGASAADLVNFRLNVKKIQDYETLASGQRGGTSFWGDIVLISLIPSYPVTGNEVGDLWRSMAANDKYLASDLRTKGNGAEAIRGIVRIVFNSGRGVDKVDIYDKNTDLAAIFSLIETTGAFAIDWNTYFKNRLLNLRGTTPSQVPPVWKENELNIKDQIARISSEWTRDGDDYVRKNKDGVVVESKPLDACQFVTDSLDDCIAFLNECALASSDKFPAMCRQFVNNNSSFKVSVAKSLIAEKVMKLDPRVAFLILRQFNFGSYEATDNEPVRGFRRYKVQRVGEWLQDLNNPEVRKHFGTGSEADAVIKEILALPGLLDYLSVLVEWININPQMLNPEEGKDLPTPCQTAWPKPDKSFNMYDHINPYRAASIRLYGLSCGLERIKSSIMDGFSGINGQTLLSNIAQTPLDINNPLSRNAFTYGVPVMNIGMMHGGGDIEQELQNINRQYGYELFKNIYESLNNTMKNLSADSRSMRMSSESDKAIREKLEKLKQLEQEITKALERTVERNALITASRGKIQAYRLSDEELPAILAKHSNLLNWTQAYNRKAINLIDVFKTISDALLGKLQVKQADATAQYNRPLRADIPLTPTN